MPIIGIDLGTSNSAAAALRGGRPVLDGAIDFMYRIKPDMVYDTGATTVINTPPMSFALRRGVCQDFAQ